MATKNPGTERIKGVLLDQGGWRHCVTCGAERPRGMSATVRCINTKCIVHKYRKRNLVQCGKCGFLCCRVEKPDVCLLQCSVSVHEATISDSEASEALALTEFTTFPTASTIPLPCHHLQPTPELNAPTADPPFLPIPPAGPPPSSQLQLIMGSFLYSGGNERHQRKLFTHNNYNHNKNNNGNTN